MTGRCAVVNAANREVGGSSGTVIWWPETSHAVSFKATCITLSPPVPNTRAFFLIYLFIASFEMLIGGVGIRFCFEFEDR